MPSIRALPARNVKGGVSLESSEGISARLDEMERKIERLRSLYESFFLGVERRPPHVPRQELNRLMLETQQISIRNAALRFRFQTLSQRWTLLATYWNRTLREMEAGTYRRDLQKAYRRIAERGQPLTETEAAALGIPAARAQAFVSQQNRRWGSTPGATATGAGSAPKAPAAPAIADGGGSREEVAAPASSPRSAPQGAVPQGTPVVPVVHPAPEVDLARIHRAYAEAHAQLALPGPPPTAERLRAQVLPQLERLRAAHPGARLDVAVVSQNGRLVIRAKPVR
ncbi:MAG: hypothetical protein ABUL67_01085 [Haliangium ochraceum]